MISNFSEVEKSLKRCLKEKVSITAATVVGFLIAGTVAFGAATDVIFSTNGTPNVTVQVGGGGVTSITGTEDSISVDQYKTLVGEGEPLANLLIVNANKETGEATFASAVDEKGNSLLGKVTAEATTNGALTLIKTDDTYKSIISELTIEATGFDAEKTATAMEAANSGDKVTNAGTITVGDNGVGLLAGVGATAVNSADGKIIVNSATNAVGMSAVTEATKTTTLTNNGKITVTKGTGISVAGAGEAEVAFGAAGEIEVADAGGNIGINIAGTGTTTVTGAAITLAGAGKGINAGGNVTLENIELNFGDNATGTGIVYAGGGTDKAIKAEISTGDMAVAKGGATGIDATTSKVAESTLNIKTGSISTGNASATGIKITGSSEEVEEPGAGKTATTANVTTTLGETKGIGVDVTGKAYSGITVNIGDDNGTSTAAATKAEVSGTGVKVTGAENGEVTVKINQQNLKVTGTGNLVDIQAGAGTTNVDINQNVELVGTGNLVNVGAITGTLNINLNVGDRNTTSKSLNVTEGNTALNLANVGDGTTSVKNTGTVTIAGKGTLLAGSSTNTISLSNQGLIDLKVVNSGNTEDNNKANNSVISTGEKVNVANYGTITLNIGLNEFLGVAKVKSLDELTTEKVQDALKTLGVIDTNSTGTFSSVGYIRFKNGELFTTAKALTGEQTVEGLSSALNQEDSDRAFAIAKGDNFTLNSAGENEKLENVQFSLDGTMTIGGTEEVKIENAGVERQVYITGNGKLEVENDAILNYSGNISADNVVNNNNNAAIENNGTLTLENGALNMVVPKAEVASLSEPANRVGILVKGDKTTNLNNFTVNADIEGELSGGSALQGTLSAKGKSRITGNVTNISKIEVTDNGMLTFGANSKIIVSGATSGEKTEIDLTDGKMGVEIGESGNVLMNSVGKIKFTGTYGANKSDESNKGKVVLLTNALTENTTFNLGTHDGLKDGDIIANGDIYYNITQGNGGIWNAT
ncbi:beta strand repeat-containing protein, partial [Fusobacterium varium]